MLVYAQAFTCKFLQLKTKLFNIKINNKKNSD